LSVNNHILCKVFTTVLQCYVIVYLYDKYINISNLTKSSTSFSYRYDHNSLYKYYFSYIQYEYKLTNNTLYRQNMAFIRDMDGCFYCNRYQRPIEGVVLNKLCRQNVAFIRHMDGCFYCLETAINDYL